MLLVHIQPIALFLHTEGKNEDANIE